MADTQEEIKPDETLLVGEHDDRINRIIHMLIGNKAKTRARGEDIDVRILDGKAYVVSNVSLEIWDYFLFLYAVRKGLIPVELVK